MDPQLEIAVNLANKEFIKGFIFGQLLLCILMFFVVKIFLLRNSTETKIEIMAKKQNIVLKSHKDQKRTMDMNILAKLRVDTNHFESCDFLSVFIAQILSVYRNDQEFLNNFVSIMDGALNKDTLGFISRISITELSLGDEYPIFKNARIKLTESGIMTLIDFTYDDQVSIGIDTQMILNWPKEYMASLPISLGFILTRFSGTLVIEFVDQSHVGISVLEDIVLEFQVKSLLGHRTKVKDLPKLQSLISMRIKQTFVDLFVYPRHRVISLPSKTRE